MRFLALAVLAAMLISLAGCNRVVIHERREEVNPDGSRSTVESRSINGELITELRETWETEYVTGTGSAPLVDRYNDYTRDKELARRGAVLDAMADLASKVTSIEITETVSMNDLVANEYVESRLQAVLQDVEVTSEVFNESSELWQVTVRMPKVRVVDVVEEWYSR